MTQEQQRIKIAEVRGYIRDEAGDCWRKDGLCYFVEDPHHLKQLPDYLNDLNAMHEAEKALTQDQMVDYSRHVGKKVTMYLPASRAAWMDFRLIHATAAQRAEAFLKTLNLWTEE